MMGSWIMVRCGDTVGVPVFRDAGISACRMRNSVICGSLVVEGELSLGEGGALSVGGVWGLASSSGGSLCRLVLALSVPKTRS